MSNRWNCDLCGKQTFMNPAAKPVFEQQGVKTVPRLDPETKKPLVKIVDGKPELLVDEVPNMVPVMEKMRRQNLHNGTIEEIPVQKIEYLEEPAVLVKLKVGHENIQRDFCRECLNKYCGAEIKQLMDKLWTIQAEHQGE